MWGFGWCLQKATVDECNFSIQLYLLRIQWGWNRMQNRELALSWRSARQLNWFITARLYRAWISASLDKSWTLKRWRRGFPFFGLLNFITSDVLTGMWSVIARHSGLWYMWSVLQSCLSLWYVRMIDLLWGGSHVMARSSSDYRGAETRNRGLNGTER